MKNYLFLLFILVFTNTNSLFAQGSTFKFESSGFTDFVVTECEGKTQTELYKKTLEWVSVNYKNPKEVIKAQIENEYIRIEGSDKNLICKKALGLLTCNLATYQIEISFKEGKYKFDIIELKEFNESSKYTVGGWSVINLNKAEDFFNKKGEPRSVYKNMIVDIPLYFNGLNNNLKTFIMNNEIPSKNDNW